MKLVQVLLGYSEQCAVLCAVLCAVCCAVCCAVLCVVLCVVLCEASAKAFSGTKWDGKGCAHVVKWCASL